MNTEVATTTHAEWKLPSHRKVGMICLIITESALFSIFVVAYLFYTGKSLNSPYPKEVLAIPIAATICLLSSSFTIVFAEKMLHRGSKALFHLWWVITMLLGLIFLGYTAVEWYTLIYRDHLTISTNVFGTTFYSLVGLHATHVIVGLLLLSLILISSLRGKLDKAHYEHAEMISWYWHFVDWIWVVVLIVAYIKPLYL
ncbi:MAG: cytochrome c oxidase subunit 3 [Chthoniobacterales bacterium]